MAVSKIKNAIKFDNFSISCPQSNAFCAHQFQFSELLPLLKWRTNLSIHGETHDLPLEEIGNLLISAGHCNDKKLFCSLAGLQVEKGQSLSLRVRVFLGLLQASNSGTPYTEHVLSFLDVLPSALMTGFVVFQNRIELLFLTLELFRPRQVGRQARSSKPSVATTTEMKSPVWISSNGSVRTHGWKCLGVEGMFILLDLKFDTGIGLYRTILGMMTILRSLRPIGKVNPPGSVVHMQFAQHQLILSTAGGHVGLQLARKAKSNFVVRERRIMFTSC